MVRNFSYIIRSLFFFLSGIIKKREYDVIFYYPQHFNRGLANENQFFKHLLLSCEQNNISYIVFEEPDFLIKSNRNSRAIPFDFIYLIIILLRKLYSSETSIQMKDQKIGDFISKIFFRRFCFKQYITLSQSMMSIFRGINSNARLYDLQHGIIHNNKKNYLVDGSVESNLKDNDAHLLLSGESFKDTLITNDNTNYFKSHAFVIGSHISASDFIHQESNNNVLVTLQFTKDHSKEENTMLLNKLKVFILSSGDRINFYLKHHPRFHNEVDLSEIMQLPNTQFAPDDINDCFKLCSLHATTYSTCTFEAALLGIPTILIYSRDSFNFFFTDFGYPLQYAISDYNKGSLYQDQSRIVQKWASEYYTPFNEAKFLDLLQ